MLKLQWLQIHKFRSVKPGTRLTFSPSFNVLLGQNGTGKTTLLNLVAAVVSSDFTPLRNEEFELDYELAIGTERMTVSARNVRAAKPLSPALEGLPPGMLRTSESLNSPVLSVEIRVDGSGAASPILIRFDGTQGTVKVKDVAAGWEHEQAVPRVDEQIWQILAFTGIAFNAQEQPLPEHLLKTVGVAIVNTQTLRFDESLGYFTRLGESQFSVARTKGQTRAVGISATAPPKFWSVLEHLATQNWAAERYILHSKQVSLLDEVSRLLGFKSAEAIVDLQESGQRGTFETLTLSNLRFLFVRPNGSKLSEQHLSYGQKRMLAFMYYLAMEHSVVIADELVNGLHHSWIRACIEALGERQVFLTSQNPLLLDYLTFDSAEQVRSTFVLTRWSEGEEGGQMLWENMSQEAAEDFFASYKVGFQQVGELLQSKGLW